MGAKKTAEQMNAERRQKKQARKGAKSRRSQDEGFSFDAIKKDQREKREENRRLRQERQDREDRIDRILRQAVSKPVVINPRDTDYAQSCEAVKEAVKIDRRLVADFMPNGMVVCGLKKSAQKPPQSTQESKN